MSDEVNWKQHAYTVGELKKRLNDFPDDTPIIMSKDGEGNDHSPLAGIWPAHYEAETTWSGDIKDTEDDYEKDLYDSYQDYLGAAVPVVLLGPVN